MENYKLDLLRRLFLGKLYNQCQAGSGVSEDDLRARLEELKRSKCVGNCSLEDISRVCSLKSHYPECIDSDSDNDCIEDHDFDNNKEVYREYKNVEKEYQCPICLQIEDEEDKQVETFSCGHKMHRYCLVKTAESMQKDRATCPMCNKVFPLEEVPVRVREISEVHREQELRNIRDTIQYEDITGLMRVYEQPIDELISELGMSAEEFISRFNLEGRNREIVERATSSEGPFEIYYSNGVLNEEGTYVGGQREGASKRYYSSGRLAVEGSYKGGKLEGIVKRYYPDGKLEVEASYISGKLDGEFKTYYASGRIQEEGSYIRGISEGGYRMYYESGGVQEEGTYIGGTKEGRYRMYYETGGVQEEGTFIQDIPEGSFKRYYESGSLKSEGTYVGGRSEGAYRSYYESGGVQEEGTYLGGQLEGLVTKYDRSGRVMIRAEHRGGKLHGMYRSYYPDGEMRFEVRYVNGIREESGSEEARAPRSSRRLF
jgi:antitoxin component YwqK of YwqJK toxin-antitoxin module